uniref:Uncharacterized protein n=1 Tax=Zea mays TaxID=4577 RepID=C4J329_MAIZE|nr:unknown [Zea mays]
MRCCCCPRGPGSARPRSWTAPAGSAPTAAAAASAAPGESAAAASTTRTAAGREEARILICPPALTRLTTGAPPRSLPRLPRTLAAAIGSAALPLSAVLMILTTGRAARSRSRRATPASGLEVASATLQPSATHQLLLILTVGSVAPPLCHTTARGRGRGRASS